jgi:hypothetical protein
LLDVANFGAYSFCSARDTRRWSAGELAQRYLLEAYL